MGGVTLRDIARRRGALNRAVFDWCLRSMQRCLSRAAIEPALQWGQLAARSAVHQGFGQLVSGDLETALQTVALQLPLPSANPSANSGGRRRWLHVLDQAHGVGGHTVLVERWIRFDPTRSHHSVMLLSQPVPVPQTLADAVCQRDGKVHSLPEDSSLFEKAEMLRREAWENADVVVLHTHPYSVVPLVAFAVSGGPPVAYLNHLSQQFWVGACIADLVINLRETARDWSEKHRGIDRNVILPIPVSPRLPCPVDPSARQALGLATRARLGITAKATVLLTIGTEHKYLQLPGLDFVEVIQRLLRRLPLAHAIAIGPSPDDIRWRRAEESTGGRVHVLGPQSDLGRYHAAADIFLEGFPHGSMTALLEAALVGIPCVRAPRSAPPPFTADGIALAAVDQPDDEADYVTQTVALVENSSERQRLGSVLSAAVRAHHSETNWPSRLLDVHQLLPERHRVYSLGHTVPLPDFIQDFALAYATSYHHEDTLTYTLRAARANGLEARMDARLVAAFVRACLINDPRLLRQRSIILPFAASILGPTLAYRVDRLINGVTYPRE